MEIKNAGEISALGARVAFLYWLRLAREMWAGKGALKLQPANVWLDTGGGKKEYQELGDTDSQALAIGPTVWSFGAAVKLSDARARRLPSRLEDPINQLDLMPYAAVFSMHNPDAPYWQRFDDDSISAAQVSHSQPQPPRACTAGLLMLCLALCLAGARRSRLVPRRDEAD